MHVSSDTCTCLKYSDVRALKGHSAYPHLAECEAETFKITLNS